MGPDFFVYFLPELPLASLRKGISRGHELGLSGVQGRGDVGQRGGWDSLRASGWRRRRCFVRLALQHFHGLGQGFPRAGSPPGLALLVSLVEAVNKTALVELPDKAHIGKVFGFGAPGFGISFA